ncbi:MAG: hypothetical protein ACLQHL_04490 [Candidatus Cybelea sp.]
MKNAAFAFLAATLTLTVTLPARSATGMEAMKYYVGTWSCTGGPIGKQPFHFRLRYAMNGGILQSWLSANGYVQSGSLTYDSKNDRYINAAVANDGTWFVAYATISGTAESSIDHVTSEGKLGRLIIVRTSNTSFASTGYPAVSDGKAFFKATCRKS